MLFSTTDVTMKKTLHINPNINKKKAKREFLLEQKSKQDFHSTTDSKLIFSL